MRYHATPSGLVPYTEAEEAARDAEEAAYATSTIERLQASLLIDVQKRLDDFARTRGYDGILSAASYATSTNPKFSAEGQRCVELRDATWASCYAMLGEVLAGTRPVPEGYDDIAPELPALTWTN